MKLKSLYIFLSPLFIFGADDSHANVPHLNGQDLSILWVVPFVGILLSIAIFPLVAHEFWHHNF